MLTNKTKTDIEVIYNQRPIMVKAGQDLDVRDFGVPSTSIEAVERHIIRKNPDIFDQEKTKDKFKTNKAALKRIKELEDENEALRSDVEGLQKALEDKGEVEGKVKADNEGLKDQVKSLKKEVAEFRAKLKASK